MRLWLKTGILLEVLRVAELFEARKPKVSAILAKYDGLIRFGEPTRRGRTLYIVDDKSEEILQELVVKKGQILLVGEGDHIRRGKMIIDGDMDPHELAQQGNHELANYMIDEIKKYTDYKVLRSMTNTLKLSLDRCCVVFVLKTLMIPCILHDEPIDRIW